jgi:hypothetical protein
MYLFKFIWVIFPSPYASLNEITYIRHILIITNDYPNSIILSLFSTILSKFTFPMFIWITTKLFVRAIQSPKVMYESLLKPILMKIIIIINKFEDYGWHPYSTGMLVCGQLVIFQFMGLVMFWKFGGELQQKNCMRRDIRGRNKKGRKMKYLPDPITTKIKIPNTTGPTTALDSFFCSKSKYTCNRSGRDEVYEWEETSEVQGVENK